MFPGYAELLPGFSVPPTPRERDSLAARLQQLASAAQAETLRRLADRPRQAPAASRGSRGSGTY